jgi:hypothetical protein
MIGTVCGRIDLPCSCWFLVVLGADDDRRARYQPLESEGIDGVSTHVPDVSGL